MESNNIDVANSNDQLASTINPNTSISHAVDPLMANLTREDEINYLLSLTDRGHLTWSKLVKAERIRNRVIMDIDVMDVNTNTTIHLHVDAVEGAPTLEQVADCVYGSGAGSDLRVIIYEDSWSNEYNTEAPGNAYLVTELVAIAIHHGMLFDLIEAPDISKIMPGKHSYRLNEDVFDCMDQSNLRSFPTRRQILEAEFWSLYYHPQWVFQGAEDVHGIYEALGEWAPGYGLRDKRTKAVWNDGGLFMCIEGSPDADDMKWLKENFSVLDKSYPGCPINIELGNELVISVRVLDIPMKDLIEMSPEKKWEYGEYLYEEEHNFADAVGEALDQYEAMNIQKNENGPAVNTSGITQ